MIYLLLFSISAVHAQTAFTGKPMYNIAVKRGGVPLGDIQIELFPTIAPLHVHNFDSLVNVQFYDTTAFHRVVPNFMIQGGDPNSRHGHVNTWGQGQAGQPTVNAEFTAARHVRGALSAARKTDPNTATSQFFICVANYPSLNGSYSVYGRVIGGMNIADSIVLAPRNSADRPYVKHEMFITAIGSNDTVPDSPVLNAPVHGTENINPVASLLLKWNPNPDGIIYTVEVAHDSLFTDIIKTIESGSTLAYITSGLVMNTRYFWRVNVNNGGHSSSWSSVWSFKTQADALSIGKQEAPDTKITVFPNPGRDVFYFNHLTAGSVLEIVDISGKMIHKINIRGNTQTVNLEGKAKGIYTYSIRSENKEIICGKLVLE